MRESPTRGAPSGCRARMNGSLASQGRRMAVLTALLVAAIAAVPHSHAAPAVLVIAPHVAGEMLVGLPAEGETAVEARLALAGMKITRKIPKLGLAVVQTADDADAMRFDDAALADASAQAVQAGAIWAEPNYLFFPEYVPDDPDYAVRQSPYLARLEMTAAWDVTTGRPEIVVAILDTGVNTSHADLAAGIWTNPGEIPGNGVDDEGNGFVDDVHGWDFAEDDNLPTDDHGHGTHVAGIVGARIGNGLGIAGMAGNVTLMPVDVFRGGTGTYADLIEAIIYATDNGADVINMSLGATSYSRGEEAAVDYAAAAGVVVVAAAGNTARNSYFYPAAHPNTIAVAATDASDIRAGFSTYGEFVDVAAPGVAIWSTYFSGYGPLSGTSMAAPHVAGLAALILSADPTLTAAQVRARIEGTADDLGATGWDPYFGYGRINARRALEGLPVNPVPLPPTPPTPHRVWPQGCIELIASGAFEDANLAWQTEGDVSQETIAGPSGDATQAMRLAGAAGSHGTLAQPFRVPVAMRAATLQFFYRIESRDPGWGTTPQSPWDDTLTLEWRASDGALLRSLLRTGNTADNSSDGLAWDEYLYVVSEEDLAMLREHDSATLVFEAKNDDDAYPTTFFIDDVRLCAANPSFFLPLVTHD